MTPFQLNTILTAHLQLFLRSQRELFFLDLQRENARLMLARAVPDASFVSAPFHGYGVGKSVATSGDAAHRHSLRMWEDVAGTVFATDGDQQYLGVRVDGALYLFQVLADRALGGECFEQLDWYYWLRTQRDARDYPLRRPSDALVNTAAWSLLTPGVRPPAGAVVFDTNRWRAVPQHRAVASWVDASVLALLGTTVMAGLALQGVASGGRTAYIREQIQQVVRRGPRSYADLAHAVYQHGRDHKSLDVVLRELLRSGQLIKRPIVRVTPVLENGAVVAGAALAVEWQFQHGTG